MEIILIGVTAVILVVVIIVWWIGTSNTFKRMSIKTQESLSGIEVALTKRYDTLTKLLDVVKAYASHEKELYMQVIQLRRGMTVGQLNEAGAQIDSLFARVNAVAEAYPEMRSTEMFRELQSAIRDTEEHLQASRRLYNSTVTSYNTEIAVFPSSIVANAQRLQRSEFFEAESGRRADVQMKF